MKYEIHWVATMRCMCGHPGAWYLVEVEGGNFIIIDEYDSHSFEKDVMLYSARPSRRDAMKQGMDMVTGSSVADVLQKLEGCWSQEWYNKHLLS